MAEVTKENFFEMINRRDIKDALNAAKHPVKSMDDSGYTYLDYALFKHNQHGKPLVRILLQINDILENGDNLPYIK